MAVPTTTTLTLNSQPDLTRRHKFIEVAIQWTDAGAPTYVTGGLVVDLTKMLNPSLHPRAGFPAGILPANNDISPITLTGGWVMNLEKNGTSPTLKNYVVRIYKTYPKVEYANGDALDATLFGATVGASPKFVFRIRLKNWV